MPLIFLPGLPKQSDGSTNSKIPVLSVVEVPFNCRPIYGTAIEVILELGFSQIDLSFWLKLNNYLELYRQSKYQLLTTNANQELKNSP